MTNPVIYAAAYVLIMGGQLTPAPVPAPERPISDPIMCQLPGPPAPVSGHMAPHRLAIVRADPRGGWHHHRHCHRMGRHWRCR